MNGIARELVPTLFRTTALLTFSAVAARLLLARLALRTPSTWRLACLLTLLPGVLFVRFPVPLPLVNHPGPTRAVAESAVGHGVAAPREPRTETDGAGGQPQAQGPSAIAATAVVSDRGPARPAWTLEEWPVLVAIAWLGGMLGMVAILLVGYVRFAWNLRTEAPEEPRWAAEWEALFVERGLRPGPPLRMSADLGPMLCRLPRGYCVVVPAWLWRQLDAQERRVILRHELAHYTGGDLWKSLAIRVLALPHWFNPFAWWAVRTFDECGEWACDDAAMEPDPTSATAYARALLRLSLARPGRPAYGFSARGSSVATRVRRLLRPTLATESRRARGGLVGLLLLLAVIPLFRPEFVGRSTAAEESTAVRTDLYGDPLPEGAIARLGTTRLRPGASIERLAFASDGKTLACADDSRTLTLYDVPSGKLIRRLNLRGASTEVLSYLPGGKSLAVIRSHDGATHLWDFANQPEVPPSLRGMVPRGPIMQEIAIGEDRETFGVSAVSPDGRLLAGGSSGHGTERDRKIRLWELSTGKRLDELKLIRDLARRPGSILWIAFSHDGRTLLSLSGDPGRNTETFNKGGIGTLYSWDVASGTEIRHFEIPLPNQQGSRRSLAISPDERLLALGSPARAIHLIRLQDGTEVRRVDGLDGPVHSLVFSADGAKLLSGGQDSTVRVWDTATGRQLGPSIKHASWVEAIALAPDGKMTASGGQDYLIRLWDTDTAKDPAERPAHRYWIWNAAFSADGSRVVTSDWDNTIRLWDASTGQQRHLLEMQDGLAATALAPDGRVLAAASGRIGEVRLLDPESFRELRRLEGRARGGYSTPAFSTDGTRVVAAAREDRIVRLWDAATGRSLRLFRHEEPVSIAVISPTGAIVASAGVDLQMGGAGNVIRLWDARTGESLRDLRGFKGSVNALAFSPDGRWLASGGFSRREGFTADHRPVGSPDLSDSIHLWEVATGSDLRQFPGEPDEKARDHRSVNGLAFTPDGQTLISAEEDGSIRLYEASNGASRGVLRGHRGEVHAISVSADGRRLVSAGSDLTGLVWDLTKVVRH